MIGHFCVVIYFLVAIAVASNLTLPEIIIAKDYELMEKPIGSNTMGQGDM